VAHDAGHDRLNQILIRNLKKGEEAMCLSLGWLENLLIWAIVIVAAIAIVKLFLPRLLGALGEAGALVMAVLNILLWAAVAVFVIIIVFDLLGCLLGWPSLRHY
jgi:hypothetical protein